MPQSGYIKPFVIEDTGYKFYTNENLTMSEYLTKHANELKDKPTPIFTLVLVKN